ncbi:hypothetical protein MMC29_000279 [Sticta canariensis]|nr:hypothetical protein [Sticta canariensis]
MEDSKNITAGRALVYDVDEKHGHGDVELQPASGTLTRALKGRHMQMIAIGGSIGAGLFVGSGSALRVGGPASVLLGFMIVGCMLFFTVQALGELAVLYPVNGAFYAYAVRFIDPSWGFAMGWDYAIGWLIVLPFELVAAGITINFWRSDINIGVWITVFLAMLVVVQIFGVRGYGEVEFVLGLIKVVAVIGFIILGIIIDCGGVPTDNRGYIGAHYWHDPGAFRHGFKGFCSVFVTAAFAFAGTELVGLAAAEAADPRKSLPKATKQVFWRIAFFYVVSLFIVGLILPSDDDSLVGSSGANTKASPFVLAIQMAGIKGLPSVFNAVITISVLSVANSCSFGSTRTMQALGATGMGPKILTYIDGKGRPVTCVIIQLLFGLLAFITEASDGLTVFAWLLSFTGLSSFFVWGSICLSHIRFRHAWKVQGHSLDELPYKASSGVVGSFLGLLLNILALIATFYSSLWPVDGSPDPEVFFQSYLAAPFVIILYLGYKIYSRGAGGIYVKAHEIDLITGMRVLDLEPLPERKKSIVNLPSRVLGGLF